MIMDQLFIGGNCLAFMPLVGQDIGLELLQIRRSREAARALLDLSHSVFGAEHGEQIEKRSVLWMLPPEREGIRPGEAGAEVRGGFGGYVESASRSLCATGWRLPESVHIGFRAGSLAQLLSKELAAAKIGFCRLDEGKIGRIVVGREKLFVDFRRFYRLVCVQIARGDGGIYADVFALFAVKPRQHRLRAVQLTHAAFFFS